MVHQKYDNSITCFEIYFMLYKEKRYLYYILNDIFKNLKTLNNVQVIIIGKLYDSTNVMVSCIISKLKIVIVGMC